ncbi:hypothetical protein B484DRAFT_394725 [Ochromonadaceae sp. CCMP2298]|nr:hypothetical protein B484DRAFT_394725 [Ochromonadaceae sp. CCMP2298]
MYSEDDILELGRKLWRARVMLMRMENLRLRKMEETERLRKREEEAREQTELLRMREQEEEEQGERPRQREEEAREQTERLRKRKEEIAKLSYSAEILRCAEHCSKAVSTGLEYRLKGMSG